ESGCRRGVLGGAMNLDGGLRRFFAILDFQQKITRDAQGPSHAPQRVSFHVVGTVAAGAGAFPSTTWMPLTTPTRLLSRAPTCASTMSSAGRPVARIWAALVQAFFHCLAAHVTASGLEARVRSLGRPLGSLCSVIATIPSRSWVSGRSRRTNFNVAVT